MNLVVIVIISLVLLGWIALSARRLRVLVSESNAASKEQLAQRTRTSAACRRCRFFERLSGEALATHLETVERAAKIENPFFRPMSAGARDLIRKADVGRCHRFPPPGSPPRRRRDGGELVSVARQREQALAEGAEAEQQIRSAEEMELFDSGWEPIANRFPLGPA